MSEREFNKLKIEVSTNGLGIFEVRLLDIEGNIVENLEYDIYVNDLVDNPGLTEKQVDTIHEAVFNFRKNETTKEKRM